MPFLNGTVSYARFAVSGGPATVEAELLDRIAANTIRPTKIGVPAETEYGWVGPRHVYDNDFAAERVAFDRRLLLAVRIDSNKVPAEISRAYRAMAEQNRAAESPTGFISRAEKRIAREEADERCRGELAEGRYRRSKLLPVLWDLERQVILAPAFSDKAVSALSSCVSETFDATIQPLTSGALAYNIVSDRGETRHYEDARPSPFTDPPVSATSDDGRSLKTPLVPWSHKGPEPNDFLGNEFLFWLWSAIEHDGGLIETDSGRVAIAIDRSIDLACAWDATGTISVRSSHPTRLPETREALRHGKWPRKVGVLLAVSEQPFEFTFQADQFLITGLKLPKIEDAQTPRDEVHSRLDLINTIDQTMHSLYDQFITSRFSTQWPSARDRIASLVTRSRRPAPAVELTPA